MSLGVSAEVPHQPRKEEDSGCHGGQQETPSQGPSMLTSTERTQSAPGPVLVFVAVHLEEGRGEEEREVSP